MSRKSPPSVSLIYSSDQSPGISRRGAGTGFFYRYPNGNRVREGEVLDRIRSLAIPPAYKSVWICARADGHLQATGRDSRGRKQYRYHPEWQKVRNLDKFSGLAKVGEGLPRLRRRIRRELRDFDGSKVAVTAAAVRMIDKLGYRVGNEAYFRQNGTRGISTLDNGSVSVSGEKRLSLGFRGKGGRWTEAEISDELLSQAVKECQELGGQRLFTYQSGDGRVGSIDSGDINQFLEQSYRADVTAKDLRTWNASATVLECLREITHPGDREKEFIAAVRVAARSINNRYETCRQYYVHPSIRTRYLESGRYGLSRLKVPNIAEMQQSESLLSRILAES